MIHFEGDFPGIWQFRQTDEADAELDSHYTSDPFCHDSDASCDQDFFSQISQSRITHKSCKLFSLLTTNSGI